MIAEENLKIFGTLPWLVFFQGGPGFESPVVTGRRGWLRSALKTYQVLLLDQRGTGLSSAINAQNISLLTSSEEKAKYIAYFRTESIVRDAEEIRKFLLKQKQSPKWSILGQSFGGFCCYHYLSFYSHAVEKAFITGGIPPSVSDPDLVYKCLYTRVIEANNSYYERYI